MPTGWVITQRVNIYLPGWHLPTQWVGAHWVGDCPRGKVKTDARVGQNTMSEKNDTGGPRETGGQNDSINRRRFVKSLSVARSGAALGSMGVSAASASSSMETSENGFIPNSKYMGDMARQPYPNDTKNISRREIIRKTGIAAAGLAGTSGISAASKEEQEEAQNATQSQILMDSLDNPPIRDTVTVDSKWATATILHTDIGRLIYVTVDGGEQGTQFQIEAPSNYIKNGHHSVPSMYSNGASLPSSGNIVNDLDYSDIPEDGKATLIVTSEGEIQYVRTASSTEHRRLEELTGVDSENNLMLYTSVIDGFEVHSLDGDSQGIRSDSDATRNQSVKSAIGASGGREVYFVKTDKTGNLDQPSVESVDPSNELSTQGGSCLDWFERCGASISGCATCAGVCAMISISGPAGAVVCLACWFGCHGFIPYACGRAAQECGCGQC